MDKDQMHRLLEIMAQLRDARNGCPWDIEQNFESILPHTLEEAYEVADAIERRDMQALKEELGDLLFQIVFYAQMGKEAGHFDFHSITEAIADKMVERHPHVFGQAMINSSDEQILAWEEGKERKRMAEAALKDRPLSQIDGVTLGLPALLRAEKLQKRAARIGFDWPDKAPVLAKVREEIEEFILADTHDAQEEEIGDLFFALVNLARHYDISAEEALRKANKKFERRFRRIEEIVDTAPGHKYELDILDAAWNRVKSEEKN